jgi:hypothetical protein
VKANEHYRAVRRIQKQKNPNPFTIDALHKAVSGHRQQQVDAQPPATLDAAA